MPRGLKSGADWIASGSRAEQARFLQSLSDDALRALPWLFDFWALPHQLPPEGSWRSWVILGGRGAGKTRAGAEWVRRQVEGARPAARAGVLDRGPALSLRMSSGTLASASLDRVLNGANLAVIGDGSAENWEVFQFTDAVLVGERLYEISGRLRGQAGSDALMPQSWPAGSYVVMLDDVVGQIPMAAGLRGLERLLSHRSGLAGFE